MFTELGAVDTSTTSAAGKALNNNSIMVKQVLVQSLAGKMCIRDRPWRTDCP